MLAKRNGEETVESTEIIYYFLYSLCKYCWSAICTCTCICWSIYIHVHAHAHVHVFVDPYIYYVLVHAHVHVNVFVDPYIYMYMHMYMYLLILTYTICLYMYTHDPPPFIRLLLSSNNSSIHLFFYLSTLYPHSFIYPFHSPFLHATIQTNIH